MSQGESEQTVGTAGTPPGRLLFAFLGGAIAWSLHFLGSYAVVGIGCVAGWSFVPAVVVAGTVVMTAVAVWSVVVAWREWRRVGEGQPWDRALSEPPGWYAWLMTVGVLLGVTSAFAIVLEAVGVLMLPVCGWDVR